jgi:RNA polymerase sigma-70 factor (ECF subfamily)
MTVAVLDYARLADAELAAHARDGDREAFRAIMTRNNQRLFRAARGIVRDDGEAEDVLQSAYLSAFAAIGGFRGEAQLSTWLTRIVINEARGRLRSRRHSVELEAVEAAQAGGGQVLAFPARLGGEDPEGAAAQGEIRRLLEHAVDELPEAFRLVFLMREVDERSIAETAEALGVKPETVKTRLHRARRMLREVLDAKLADALTGAFPFLGPRCARITEAVLARMA